MHMRKIFFLSVALTFAFGAGGVFGTGPNLGKPSSSAELAPWDIDIEPSGAGLPPGSGTSEQGASVFADNCAACHGDGGTGATTTASGAPAAPPVVSDVKRNGIEPRLPSPITGRTQPHCSIISAAQCRGPRREP
jgi:hypothetical protein